MGEKGTTEWRFGENGNSGKKYGGKRKEENDEKEMTERRWQRKRRKWEEGQVEE